MRDVVERALYDVFTLNGVKYVPHYKNSSVYVGPGYREGGVAYSKNYMKESGATQSQEYLWIRSSFGEVKNVLSPYGDVR